jgi:hypothetical protein
MRRFFDSVVGGVFIFLHFLFNLMTALRLLIELGRPMPHARQQDPENDVLGRCFPLVPCAHGGHGRSRSPAVVDAVSAARLSATAAPGHWSRIAGAVLRNRTAADAAAARMRGQRNKTGFNDELDFVGMKIVNLPNGGYAPGKIRPATASVGSAATAGKEGICGTSTAVFPALAARLGLAAFATREAASP